MDPRLLDSYRDPASGRWAAFEPASQEHLFWAIQQRQTGRDQTLSPHILNPTTGRWCKRESVLGKKLAKERARDRRHTVKPLGNSRHVAREFDAMLREVVGDQFEYNAAGEPQRVGIFVRQTFELGGRQPASVLSFAKSIAQTVQEQILAPGTELTGITLYFPPAAGVGADTAFRNVNVRELIEDIAANPPTFQALVATIADQIENLMYGETVSGSDTVPEGHSLDFTRFQFYFREALAGGARYKTAGRKTIKSPKVLGLKLLDFSSRAGDEDCCFAQLRMAASQTEGAIQAASRNKTIRKRLAIETGPIPATQEVFDVLSEVFGMRVKVITGYSVPADEDRAFDDNEEHKHNRCLNEPELDIVVQAGGIHLPEVVLHLDVDGRHYRLVSDLLPIAQDSITGDILTVAPKIAKKVDRENLANAQRARLEQQGRVAHFQPVRGNPGKRKYTHRTLVLDYETINDLLKFETRAYGLGWFVCNDDLPENLAGRENEVQMTFSPTLENLEDDLFRFLEAAPEDVAYTIVTFNGSRFDNILLAKAAVRRGYLESIFSTGSELRDMRLFNRHTCFDVAKIAPGTSLDNACKDFRTSPAKLEGFSHRLPQEAYEHGRLAEWLEENNEQVRDYLAKDVLSTASLFAKIFNRVRLIHPSFKPFSTTGTKTAASLAWSMCKHLLPPAVNSPMLDRAIREAVIGGRVEIFQNEGKVHKIVGTALRMLDFCSLYPTIMLTPERLERFFAEEAMWGSFPVLPTGFTDAQRCELFAKLTALDETPQKLTNEDEKKLDRILMNPMRVKEYMPGKVGIYKARIHSQPSPTIIPQREKGKPLNWKPQGAFTASLTQCDIELIRGYGGRLNVISGLVWSCSEKGLWRPFVESNMVVKNQQDRLIGAEKKVKAAKAMVIASVPDLVEEAHQVIGEKPADKVFDWLFENREAALTAAFEENTRAVTAEFAELVEEYGEPNPALRQMVKIVLNSASGKVLQRNFDDLSTLCKGGIEMLQAVEKLRKDKPYTVTVIGANAVIINGKMPEKKIYCPMQAKPAYLGVFIYAYARALLWRVCLSIPGIKPYYGDTDSILVSEEDMLTILDLCPELDFKKLGRPKELGDLEQELEPHHHAVAYLIAPKQYAVLLFDEQGNLLRDDKGKPLGKLKGKGIRPRDRVVTRAVIERFPSIGKRLKAISRSVAEAGKLYEDGELEIEGQRIHLPTLHEDPEAFYDSCIVSYGEEGLAREQLRLDNKKMARLTTIILSSQFARSLDEDGQGFLLKQRFIVKELGAAEQKRAKVVEAADEDEDFCDDGDEILCDPQLE